VKLIPSSVKVKTTLSVFTAGVGFSLPKQPHQISWFEMTTSSQPLLNFGDLINELGKASVCLMDAFL
jgi:hypothetical protein